jgi:hypothetical protein
VFVAGAKALFTDAQDTVLSVADCKRILSRIARGGDATRAKDAILALQWVEAEEKEAAEAGYDRDPKVILSELAQNDGLGVVLAWLLAERHGIWWHPTAVQFEQSNAMLDRLVTDHAAGRITLDFWHNGRLTF